MQPPDEREETLRVWSGVSVYATAAQARRMARRYPGHGEYLAIVRVEDGLLLTFADADVPFVGSAQGGSSQVTASVGALLSHQALAECGAALCTGSLGLVARLTVLRRFAPASPGHQIGRISHK